LRWNLELIFIGVSSNNVYGVKLLYLKILTAKRCNLLAHLNFVH
jgi:hypothetical protein